MKKDRRSSLAMTVRHRPDEAACNRLVDILARDGSLERQRDLSPQAVERSRRLAHGVCRARSEAESADRFPGWHPALAFGIVLLVAALGLAAFLLRPAQPVSGVSDGRRRSGRMMDAEIVGLQSRIQRRVERFRSDHVDVPPFPEQFDTQSRRVRARIALRALELRRELVALDAPGEENGPNRLDETGTIQERGEKNDQGTSKVDVHRRVVAGTYGRKPGGRAGGTPVA